MKESELQNQWWFRLLTVVYWGCNLFAALFAFTVAAVFRADVFPRQFDSFYERFYSWIAAALVFLGVTILLILIIEVLKRLFVYIVTGKPVFYGIQSRFRSINWRKVLKVFLITVFILVILQVQYVRAQNKSERLRNEAATQRQQAQQELLMQRLEETREQREAQKLRDIEEMQQEQLQQQADIEAEAERQRVAQQQQQADIQAEAERQRVAEEAKQEADAKRAVCLAEAEKDYQAAWDQECKDFAENRERSYDNCILLRSSFQQPEIYQPYCRNLHPEATEYECQKDSSYRYTIESNYSEQKAACK